VTTTVKKGLGKYNMDVLSAARDNLPLAEVGIKAVMMRRAMPGGVALAVFEDQKREKTIALAVRLLPSHGSKDGRNGTNRYAMVDSGGRSHRAVALRNASGASI
jgi:hypothetical protein